MVISQQIRDALKGTEEEAGTLRKLEVIRSKGTARYWDGVLSLASTMAQKYRQAGTKGYHGMMGISDAHRMIDSALAGQEVLRCG